MDLPKLLHLRKVPTIILTILLTLKGEPAYAIHANEVIDN